VDRHPEPRWDFFTLLLVMVILVVLAALTFEWWSPHGLRHQ
jgi:hypothetical protein